MSPLLSGLSPLLYSSWALSCGHRVTTAQPGPFACPTVLGNSWFPKCLQPIPTNALFAPTRHWGSLYMSRTFIKTSNS